MFDPKELKVILTTLSKRRAWLLKTLETPDLDEDDREEHITTLKLLDSGIQKLARGGSNSQSTKTPQRAQGSSSASAQSAPPPPKKPTKRAAVDPCDAYVLIAEDNRDSAELLRGILEDMGIKRIDLVEDGRAAVYALQNCSPPYDIVLCDWDMPEMTGLEVRKSVKTLAKLRDTHFVMVTAVSEASRIREAIMHGVNDYIVKPVDVDILEKKLRTALAGATQPKEDVLIAKAP